MRPGAESFGWDQAAAAGLIAVCPITELEFFDSARSPADRAQGIQDMRSLFGWVPVHDRAFARAWDVQGELTSTASTGARARWTWLSPRPRNCMA